MPLGLALCMRISLKWIMPGFIEGHVRDTSWGVFDGAERCLREFAKSNKEAIKPGDLLKRLREINAKLASITLIQPAPRPVPEPPRFFDLRLLAVSSWPFLLVPAFFGLVELKRAPDIWARVVDAWTPEEEKNLEYIPEIPKVKVDFPYKAPSNPRPIKILGEDKATRVQMLIAQRRGAYLAGEYNPQDIGAFILVRIPDIEFYSFMIYDPVTDKMVSDRIIHLRSLLPRRVFVRIDKATVWVPNY